MAVFREIRADFDRETIVVYQAYNDEIADAALAAGRFAPPFSMNRMTWIKPSFLWLMERSGWGTKRLQERTLAVRIARAGWESALSRATLTSWEPAVHGTPEAWRSAFGTAAVHVQWDPERSLRGGKLQHRSIQVGLSRRVIGEYVAEWTREILDLTPRVAAIRRLREAGRYEEARRLLPDEKPYAVELSLARRLGMAE